MCSNVFLSPTQWAGAARARGEDEEGANPDLGISRLEGSGTWALVSRV